MKIKSLLGMGLILGLAGTMSGCGSSDTSVPAASGPSGTVLQGPVSGATVVAKKDGNNDYSKAETGEVTATTGTGGVYKFQTAPAYAHTLVVLPNGTDTLTGKANIQLIAKAGSKYISALTTLVATDTTGKVEAKLVALAGGAPGSSIGDVDVTNTTPAALVLTKTIETAVAAMSETITKAAGTATISPTQMAAIQTQALQAITTEIAKPAVSLVTLQTPSTLTTTVMTPAITAAVTKIDSDNANITVTSAATIATAIANNAVDSSAKAINGATSGKDDAAPKTSTQAIAEGSKINATTAAAIATATTTAVTESKVETSVTVTATPTTYVPPVVPTGSTGTSSGSF